MAVSEECMKETSVKKLNKQKNKKWKPFWKGYLIGVIVLVIIMAALLILGYNVLIDYDESQRFPSDAASNYALAIDNGSYAAFLADEGNAACVFEPDVYEDLVDETLEGCEITYSKAYSADRITNPVYSIKADGESVADVSFVLKSEKSRFGFGKYQLDHFSSLIEGSYEVRVMAPDDAVLYINNIDVPRNENWVSDEDVSNLTSNEYSLTEVSETESSSAQKMIVYDICGLINEPEIKVTSSKGEAMHLEFNQTLNAWCTVQDNITVVAPSNFSVSVNGVALSDSDKWTLESGLEYEEISGISQYMDEQITLTKYFVTGVNKYNASVTAKNYAGENVHVSYDETENCYYVQDAVSEEYVNEHGLPTEKLISYAEMYAEFVANDGERWSTIMPDVMPDSELYSTFDEFWATLADHNSYWFENMKIADISFYAEDAFSCRTTFVYWIKGFNGQPEATEDYPTDVTFFYVYENGKWYITDYYLSK